MSVTQSLSRAMRPCDDVVGLIGEAVVRKREADTLEYWRDLYTGSEHHWSGINVVGNPSEGYRWGQDTVIGIRKGQSWCTLPPFDEEERRRYEEAREDPEVGGEALFELEKQCEERRDWFRVQDQLVKEHRYKWSKLGKWIKWVSLTRMPEVEYIKWRGAGFDAAPRGMWTESATIHRMDRNLVRLHHLRRSWDRLVGGRGRIAEVGRINIAC